MKTRIVFLPFLFLLTMAAAAQPSISIVGGDTFSLDTLMAGTIAEHTIVVRNSGDAPLEIEKVEAACGCTGTMMSSQSIPPGGTGELLITFNSKNFSGNAHKSVSIVSNDPKKKNHRVDFDAFVIQELQISESRFLFKDAVVGERKSASVTLTNNSKKNLELKGYETNLAGLTLKHPSVVPPGESVELVAEYLPKEPKRSLSSNVSIKTSSESKPEILLYVFGSVKEWKFE